MAKGKLRVKSTYCKPDGGGLHVWTATCGATGRVAQGVGSRTTAAKELKADGWLYSKEHGWLSVEGQIFTGFGPND